VWEKVCPGLRQTRHMTCRSAPPLGYRVSIGRNREKERYVLGLEAMSAERRPKVDLWMLAELHDISAFPSLLTTGLWLLKQRLYDIHRRLKSLA
jgi:hypothetical protein